VIHQALTRCSIPSSGGDPNGRLLLGVTGEHQQRSVLDDTDLGYFKLPESGAGQGQRRAELPGMQVGASSVAPNAVVPSAGSNPAATALGQGETPVPSGLLGIGASCFGCESVSVGVVVRLRMDSHTLGLSDGGARWTRPV
jgi:hypothetical protein